MLVCFITKVYEVHWSMEALLKNSSMSPPCLSVVDCVSSSVSAVFFSELYDAGWNNTGV